MELRVITAEINVANEPESIRALIDEGAAIHVRKPGFSENDMSSWLDQFPVHCRPLFHVHGMPLLARKYGLRGIHLKEGEVLPKDFGWLGELSASFHSVEDLQRQANEGLDYVFLSPVFDSISKKGYAAKFEYVVLEQFLMNKPEWLKVFALGGITDTNVLKVKELGFDGAAVLGYIWEAETTKERVNRYRKLVEAYCQV